MPPEPPRQTTYAVTISTFLQQPHFQVTSHAELFLTTLLRYKQQGKFQLHAFVIMPDHVHLLITPAGEESIGRCIQFIKGGYSFAVRKLTPKEIWHSGYHEHRIRDLTDYNNQVRYIAKNPAAAGLPATYPFVHTHPSNARNLDPTPADLLS